MVAHFLLLSHFSRCGILLLRLLGNQSVEEKFLFCKNVQCTKYRQSFLKKSFSIFFPYFLRMLHFFVSLLSLLCKFAKNLYYSIWQKGTQTPFFSKSNLILLLGRCICILWMLATTKKDIQIDEYSWMYLFIPLLQFHRIFAKNSSKQNFVLSTLFANHSVEISVYFCHWDFTWNQI